LLADGILSMCPNILRLASDHDVRTEPTLGRPVLHRLEVAAILEYEAYEN
jgi:hypothetical protein